MAEIKHKEGWNFETFGDIFIAHYIKDGYTACGRKLTHPVRNSVFDSVPKGEACKECLRALGRGLEADEVICSLSNRCRNKDGQIIVGDKHKARYESPCLHCFRNENMKMTGRRDLKDYFLEFDGGE